MTKERYEMKVCIVSQPKSVRARRCLVVFLTAGLSWSAPTSLLASDLTVGDFYPNDPSHPLSEMELVFIPQEGFDACEVSVTICKVAPANGSFTRLTSCQTSNEILTMQNRERLGENSLPVLRKRVLLPPQDPDVPSEMVWVGVGIETAEPCLPAWYEVPFGQGSWFIGGKVDSSEEAYYTHPHLIRERFEELELGQVVTEEMDLPCGSTHIQIQGRPF